MSGDLSLGNERWPAWQAWREMAGLSETQCAEEVGNRRISADQLSDLAGVPITQEASDWLVWETLNLRDNWQPPLPWAAILKDLEKTEKALIRLVAAVNGAGPGADFLRSVVVSDDDVIRLNEMLIDVRKRIRGLKIMGSGDGRGRRRDDRIFCYVSDCSEIWKQHGGEGRGVFKSAHTASGYDGRLLRLIEHLLQHVGFEPKPSAATIHDHIAMWEQMRAG